MPDNTLQIALYPFLLGVLRQQFAAMRKQIPGILADTDPEPLHDFRVASRRSRAAVSQMKPALDDSAAAELIDDYRVLAGVTNRLRDLDVFVDAFGEYEILLPAPMRSDCLQYFRRVHRRRKRESQSVHSFFRSPSFSDRMTRIDNQLNGKIPVKPGELPLEAPEPFARAAICARYDKVCRLGNSILDTWSDPGVTDRDGKLPDPSLHQLRIQFKKLRYLIEFFSIFFPADAVDAVIGQMKALQNILGYYNDLSIQNGILVTDIRLGRNLSPAGIAMLGALQAALFRKKSVFFDDFIRVFSQFCGDTTRGVFEKVYSI